MAKKKRATQKKGAIGIDFFGVLEASTDGSVLIDWPDDVLLGGSFAFLGGAVFRVGRR